MSSKERSLHVAIVGGGLCGIALGVALKRRKIPFTLYESRGSFTEIGAGINLSPSGVRALRLIDPSLGDKVYRLATRNEPPHENRWMSLIIGAPCRDLKDGEVFHEIQCPPTGSMTIHRQELLQALAGQMGEENARFNKKFESYSQDDNGVTIKFADGTQETASILIGCDGIHSRVRAQLVGPKSPAAKAVFNGGGAYRAVIPMDKITAAIGDSARSSNSTCGPAGYMIMYPVNSGSAVNCGFWLDGKGMQWNRQEWILPNQGAEMREASKDWGDRIQKVLSLFDQNPSFWAAFQHKIQPETFIDGRVMLIGDGAHSMPPHQGAGAACAVEDAYVLAEVLSLLNEDDGIAPIKSALEAVEFIRKPRFQQVHKYSSEGGPRWMNLWQQLKDGGSLQEWIDETEGRLNWIWGIDMKAHAQEAKAVFLSRLPPASTEWDQARL